MNTKDKLLGMVHWTGLCCLNVLKEFLFLALLWLTIWLVSTANFFFHDPTGAVTNFYCIFLGLPIGYLLIGFLRKGFKGLLIPFLVVFFMTFLGLYSWIFYPQDAVEPPFLELPMTLFFYFFALAALVALGQGIATSLSRKERL